MFSTEVLPQRLNINPRSIYGACLIGSIFAAILFGLTNIQAFIYFRTHAGRWTKFYRLIVLLLWTLDAVHLALTVHSVYHYLVINFGNFDALTEVVWSFRLQMVFNILTIYVVHLLYSHRIWIVGTDRSRVFRIIPGIVIVLGSGVVITLLWVIYHDELSMESYCDQWTVFMAFSVATFLDILIASSLWYLLASSRTGFYNTDCLITRLIRYTIDNGCLTSLCALASIIICAAMPNSSIFLSIQFIVAKLYVNSYIALLNTAYYTKSNADTVNSFELRHEHQSGSFGTSTGLHSLSHEKLASFRRSMLAHPEVEVVPPTRPLGVALSHRSILVTVEKESHIDL